ncbi:hypothetical protein [Dickeya chrysanthemi]|uniref:hypothetical protein n=1 Tax=Dickeya chrysanthemi TaxID=556 RepID=UPI000532CC1B|nr:hypothetical protein [Dickeya chrysanthemi]
MIAINIAMSFIVTCVAIFTVTSQYLYCIVRNDVSHSVIKISYNGKEPVPEVVQEKNGVMIYASFLHIPKIIRVARQHALRVEQRTCNLKDGG